MVAKKTGKSTIFDVANLAGVSIKTVSRVVNREPNVREKTREKVEAAVAQLGYQPNTSARGLSAKKSYVIGLIYENPHEFSYVKDVLNGALVECEARGYSLVLRPLTLPDETLTEDIRRFALQTRMDGMILPPPLCDMPDLETLLGELDIPCARLAPRTEIDGTITVFSNDEEASFDLTRYLIELGHRDIGFIEGAPEHRASEERLNGYRRALTAHGIRYKKSLVRPGLFDFESGQEAAHVLLGMKNPPTAILASNDDMAVGVLYEAHEKGLAIPGQLSVAGFDDTPIAQRIWPPLTTIRQPILEMTRAAVRGLIDRLDRQDVAPDVREFTCEMVVRSSTGEPGSSTIRQ